MKFCTDIRGPRRMNPTDFSDPLTLPLAPPFVVLSEINQQILDVLL